MIPKNSGRVKEEWVVVIAMVAGDWGIGLSFVSYVQSADNLLNTQWFSKIRMNCKYLKIGTLR